MAKDFYKISDDDAAPVVRCENCCYATWAAWAQKYSCGRVRGLLVFGDHFYAFLRIRQAKGWGAAENRSLAAVGELQRHLCGAGG